MIEVRKEVLAATSGKQVPWDHSALTGDFYFHLALAPARCPRSAPPTRRSEANLQQRLRQLEEELKKKSDPQQRRDWSSSTRLKERVRQLEEANRADQQRIFDIPYGKLASRIRRPGPAQCQIGSIQMQMARRGQERKGFARGDY